MAMILAMYVFIYTILSISGSSEKLMNSAIQYHANEWKPSLFNVKLVKFIFYPLYILDISFIHRADASNFSFSGHFGSFF